MLNSAVKNSFILLQHWRKFEHWLWDIILHEDSDKLKLSKNFIIIWQLVKKNLNQFYLQLFNLEIQSECFVITENYWTRLLKSLQNLMNQHDHTYFTIQNAVTHAGKLWQTLDKNKICQKLQKDREKNQQHYKNSN